MQVGFVDELLTFFTVFPLKAVSTQTKHVFTVDQGWDGGAFIKTDPTCVTNVALHA